jgi:protein-arginine kinase activator protein McsA
MEDNGTKKGKSESVGAQESAPDREDLSGLGVEELQVLLNEVLEQEDYIRAIAIRDEINKRK